MLVLSRRKGESVLMNGDSIVVTVIDIRGDKVRLGIQAAPEISVHRSEVWDRILAARLKAAKEEIGE